MPRQFPSDFRRCALQLWDEAIPEYESEFDAIRCVTSKVGMSTEALRRWRRSLEVDSGARPEITSEGRAQLKRLKKKNAELRRANEILRTASVPCKSSCAPGIGTS